MKALLSASSSLSRRLLSSQSSSAGRKCVSTAAAAHSASVARQTMLLCAIHDHRSHLSKNNNDVSRKTATNRHAFQISHPCRRLMVTSAQEKDTDVAVQAANER